jgi:hypothetical protein
MMASASGTYPIDQIDQILAVKASVVYYQDPNAAAIYGHVDQINDEQRPLLSHFRQ